MQLSSKHQGQGTKQYSDFTGGLNTTSVPEQIAENQLAECINMEFNRATGALETCCGTALIYKSADNINVDCLLYDTVNNCYLFVDMSTYKVYRSHLVDMNGTDVWDRQEVGVLTGIMRPKTAVWEDGLLIASGGALQYWNGSTLDVISMSLIEDDINYWTRVANGFSVWTANHVYSKGAFIKYSNNYYECITAHISSTTFDDSKWHILQKVEWACDTDFYQYNYTSVTTNGKTEYYVCNTDHYSCTDAPQKCNGVFVKNGRVWVWYEYRIHCSGVGDERNWNDDSNDDSSSKWLDVGYKEGEHNNAYILGVTALSTDIVILKENGNVYRLSGDYPNWALNEIARGITPLNRECYISVPYGVFIVSRAGMYLLETTADYGDIKPQNLAANITGVFNMLTIDDSIARFIPALNQIWVTGSNNRVVVFSLDYKAFFEREFTNYVTDICICNDVAFMARKNKVTRLTYGIFEDEKYSSDESVMSWSLQAKTITSFYDFLVRRLRVFYVPLMDSFQNAEILAGEEKINVPMKERNTPNPLIVQNNTLITQDKSLVFPTERQHNTAWCVYRNVAYDVKAKGTGSAISIIGLEVAMTEV